MSIWQLWIVGFSLSPGKSALVNVKVNVIMTATVNVNVKVNVKRVMCGVLSMFVSSGVQPALCTNYTESMRQYWNRKMGDQILKTVEPACELYIIFRSDTVSL